MSAKTIEEMRSELTAAGYTEDAEGKWHYRNGILATYSAIFPSIDSAYRHYEEHEYFEEHEKQYEAMMKSSEAMRGLLEELAKEADEYSLWLFGRYPETVSSSSDLDIEISITTIQKAKALLAKIAESESVKG